MISVATKPIDFRKGHDSLAAMVKNELRKDPFTVTRQAIAHQSAERGGRSSFSAQRRQIG